MYIFAGLPLFFFELAFGQYASEGINHKTILSIHAHPSYAIDFSPNDAQVPWVSGKSRHCFKVWDLYWLWFKVFSVFILSPASVQSTADLRLILFSGIGYAMFLISFFIGIYYNMVVAWSFRYLIASLTSVLPWTTCANEWNTKSIPIYTI